MADCTSRPVSWLVLERYVLDELPGDRKSDVAAHLSECPVCRGCAESIEASSVSLPALDVSASVETARPWWRRPLVVGGFGTLVAATAVVLLLVIGKGSKDTGAPLAQHFPPQRTQIKGGDLAVALVANRAGVTRDNPTDYRDGDRFKVLVTCPPTSQRITADVVVAQDGALFYPLRSREIACGNRVVLEGAFSVTGTTPMTVCVVVGPSPGIDRRGFDLVRLRRSKSAACQTLAPSK